MDQSVSLLKQVLLWQVPKEQYDAMISTLKQGLETKKISLMSLKASVQI